MLHLVVTFWPAGGGAAVYAPLTPWREIALIRQGNWPPPWPLPACWSVCDSAGCVPAGGEPDPRYRHLGVATVVLQPLAFRVVDFPLHGLPQRIEKDEISAAAWPGPLKSTVLILAAALTG